MRRAVPAVIVIALVLAVVAGLQGRLDGFGLRPLAVDEYYFAQSIRSILEDGVPSFAAGGYYARGPLLQYVTAAGTYVLGANEFAFRFPSLLLNLGSILLAYFYGRRVAGKQAALAVALILLVSSWHIEFARFARMYSAFQFVTLLFLIAVDDAFVRGNTGRRYLPHALAIVAILTHELGILLTPLLFLPLWTPVGRARFSSTADRLRFAGVGAATLLACVLFQRAPLRNWGVVDRFPDGYAPPAAGGPFRLPDFPFWSVSESAFTNLVALGAVLVVTVLALLAWKRLKSGISATDVLVGLLLVTATAHSLVLFGALLVVLVVRQRILEPGRCPRRVYLLIGLSCLIAAGWLVYGWTHPQGLGYAAGGPSVPDLLRRAFFGWPDFYIPLWLPFWRAFPLLSVAFVGAMAYHVLTKLDEPPADWLGHPAFFAGYITLCFAVLRSQYTETRYLFFIYPIMLCVIASAFVDLAGRWVATGSDTARSAARWAGAALFACLFLFSADFNPRHIARVASDEVTYRTGEFQRFRGTWYPRLDYRSVAEYVNLHAEDDARSRIVVAGQPPVSYYLDRDHAVYYSRKDPRFLNVSRDRGTVELWSNRRLLSTPAEFEQYGSTDGVLWIIEDPGFHAAPLDEEEDRGRSRKAAYRSVDGRLQVTRIVPE